MMQTAIAEPLDRAQLTALAALTDHKPRYEAVVTRARDGAKALLGYTPRRNASGLLALLHGGGHGMAVVSFLRCADTTRIIKDGPARLMVGDAGTIAFSARTERDVIMLGTAFPRCEDAG